MRSAKAGAVLVVGLLALLGGAGCGVPCSKDSNCPPTTHCRVEGDGAGVCAQDCVVSAQCEDGQACTGGGRCKARSGPLELRIVTPANGQQLTPGETVDVEGTVMMGGEPVLLTLGGTDGLQCTPVFPQTQELLPTGKREQVTFRFPGLVVGQGGGRVEVKAAVGLQESRAENVYASAITCPDCPAITLEEPANAPLAPYALAAPLAGQVAAGPGTTTLFSLSQEGVRFSLPLTLGQGGAFSRRVVPVLPGNSTVGVQYDGPTGSRVCLRHVSATAGATPLAAHASWDGASADLDLLVVPPGDTAARGACRAKARVPGCTIPTQDRAAPGPEAVLVDTLEDGAWGVLVLAVPGNEGPVRAVVTLTLDGDVVEQLGPRSMDPRLAEVWMVARVVVQGGTPAVDVLDQVLAQAPGGPPDTW